MMELLIVFLYCCGAIYFGSLLGSMSKKQKHRTTERLNMAFWSGFWMSSVVFVPSIFIISSIIGK